MRANFLTMPNPLLIVTLWLCALSAWSLGIYLLAKRKSASLNYFALSAISAGVYAGGYGAELQAESLDGMLLASRIQYLGIAFMPISWAGFAARYTGMRRLLTLPVRLFFWTIPCLIILLKAFDGHLHLIYASAAVDPTYNTLLFAPGPLYYFQLAYFYLCGLYASVLLFLFALQRHGLHRRQALTLSVVPFLPILASIIFQSTRSPFGHLDLAPFALALGILVLYFSVLRQKLVNLSPVAHSFIVEHLPEGILVFDRSRRLCEANESARAFLALGPERVGESAPGILGIEMAARALPESGRTSFETVINGRDFEVKTSILDAGDRARIGWIVTFVDIGERKRSEDRLRKMLKDKETPEK